MKEENNIQLASNENINQAKKLKAARIEANRKLILVSFFELAI